MKERDGTRRDVCMYVVNGEVRHIYRHELTLGRTLYLGLDVDLG